MMAADEIRALGVLTLLSEGAVLFALFGPRAIMHGPLPLGVLIRVAVFFFAITAVGVGLLGLRKWAALYFSLACISFAIWLFFGSIWFVPFPWNLINMTVAVLPVALTIVIVRSWSIMSWRGNWFF